QRTAVLMTVQIKDDALHIQMESEKDDRDSFANRLVTAMAKFWPTARDHPQVIQLTDIADISVPPVGRVDSFIHTVLAGGDFNTLKIRTRQSDVVNVACD